jgi:thiamine biosynthesis lipoprotein ApbE
VEVLNLWGAATRSGGRLPRKDELVNQLKDAGFKQVETMGMFPGESFYAFKAMPGGKV